MQMERATKLLKRVWKAVVWTELAALAGGLLLSSHIIFPTPFSCQISINRLPPQPLPGGDS
jgi:hypothetical protein